MAEVYHNNIIDIDLESGTLFRSFLNHTIGSGDNNANWYGVRVFRKGQPIALSGCSVQGLFMPASGSAILISDGTHTLVSGNEAAVLLPQACYNVKGQFTLAIKIIGTNSYSITDTVRIIDGVVADTYSANPVAPTAAVPTYQEILSVYDQMVAAKDGSVRFDIEQELTAAQMTQARGNIAAASESDVSDLNRALIGDAQEIVYANNYQTILPDANDAEQNKIYRIAYDVNATNIPANLPITKWVSTKPALLVTIQKLNTSLQKVQIYLDTQGLYIRNYTSVWQSWVLALDNSYNRTGLINSYDTLITSTSVVSDLNAIKTNSIHRFNFAIGDTSIPAHVPTGTSWKAKNGATLITTMNKTNYVGSTQIFICSEGIWCRVHGSVDWNAWISVAEHKYSIVVDKSGHGDYTSLTQAISDCTGIPDVKIYVLPGEYDIISEVGLIYGQDYLDNLTESWIGPNILSNRIHIVFSEGASVKCNYTGSNRFVRQRFSPFNAGEHGFTLENMRIQCRNVRYCVHDERMTSGDSYENYYLNCEMYKDNTANPDLDIVQCIGGGLGKHGQIVIKDCIFDNGAASGHWVSYHNSAASDARSKIVVSGNYFSKGGTVRFAHYGDSTDRTQCVVSNNSLGSDIEIAYETSEYDVENMQVTAWNNEIRN